MVKKYLLIVLFCAPCIAHAQFTRLLAQPPVNDGLNSQGISWIDYDNDGDDDIFVTTYASPESTTSKDVLYQNNGDGTFTTITTSAIVTEDGTGRNSTWADYDNDGLTDVFISNQHETFLFHNDGSGNFSKITTTPTTAFSFDSDHQGGAWGDYNGDGFLDLYLASYKLNDNARNVLFTNNGDGTFVQSSDADVVSTQGASQDPSWIDYDGNGTLDLFVPNYGNTPNYLYSNTGDGTFQAITDQPVTGISIASLGVSWADYDNDGDFDVLVPTNVNGSNLFFENNGDGTFTNKNAMFGSTKSSTASWADFDNDGYIDVMLAGGDGDKTYLFKNNGDKTFTDVSAAQGIANTNYSWAVASADYNNDGFIDFFIGNAHGNNQSADDILYQNTPNGNHWISIKLVGTNTNRSAIGAIVRVLTGTKWQTRTVQSKTGNNSQNSLRVHVGVGDATVIDKIVVEWPGKGFQEITSQPVDQFLTLTEPDFPAAPVEQVTANEDYGTVEITWVDNSTDETGFRVERSSDASDYEVIGETGANATSFVDDQATPGTIHSYRVASKTDVGYSTFSAVAPVYSKPRQVVTGFQDIGDKYLVSAPFELHATLDSGFEPSFTILEGGEFVSLEGNVLTILQLGTSVIGAYGVTEGEFFASDTVSQTLVVDMVTNVEDPGSANVSIYPNPAMGHIFVRRPMDGAHPLTIMNPAGQVVKSVVVDNDAAVMIKDLPPGLYIVITSGHRVKLFKK